MKLFLPLLLVVSISTLLSADDDVIASAAQRFAQPGAATVPDFQRHVVPLFGRLGCNSAKCHGSFQGQADFRLSLFGFDFAAGSRGGCTPSLRLRKAIGSVSKYPMRASFFSSPHCKLIMKVESVFRLTLGNTICCCVGSSPGQEGVDFGDARQTEFEQSQFAEEGIAFFRDKVQPLFEDNCYECHGFNNREGNFQVKTRELILEGGSRGPAIVPGDPENSLLIKAVRYSDDDLQMPQGGKLDGTEIAILEEWVRMGAPWPNRYEATAGEYITSPPRPGIRAKGDTVFTGRPIASDPSDRRVGQW